MLRRLDFAIALVHRPRMLFFDEPGTRGPRGDVDGDPAASSIAGSSTPVRRMALVGGCVLQSLAQLVVQPLVIVALALGVTFEAASTTSPRWSQRPG